MFSQLKKYSSQFFVGAYIIVTLIASLYVFSKPLDIGMDSAYYLMGAENIASGKGFSAFNIFFNDNNDKLIPVTNFQPLYSACIASLIKFHIPTKESAKIINLSFWLIFLFGWLLFIYLFFKGINLYSILSLFLVIFSCGLWGYPLKALSDIVFIGMLPLLFLCIHLESQNEGYRYTILVSILIALLILTRYAALGLFAGVVIYYLLKLILNKKLIDIYRLLIIIVVPLGAFIIWFFRNKNLTSHGMSMPVSFHHLTDFLNLPRLFEIINNLSVSALGTPARFTSFAWLVLIPVFVYIFYALYKNIRHNNFHPVFVALILSLLFYLAVIFILGLLNATVNKASGFFRYFYLTQPVFILIILYGIRELSEKGMIFKLFRYSLMLIIILNLFSGLNRTIFIFRNLNSNSEKYSFVFEKIRSFSTAGNYFMSNMSQIAYFETKKPFREIGSSENVLKVSAGQDKSLNKYILLAKSIGIESRKGASVWSGVLERLQYQTIYEDKNSILVKLSE